MDLNLKRKKGTKNLNEMLLIKKTRDFTIQLEIEY